MNIVHLVSPFETSPTVRWSWGRGRRVEWIGPGLGGIGSRPCVQSMVEFGILGLSESDVVMLTNADSFLCSDTSLLVSLAGGLCFSHRVDVSQLERRMIRSEDLVSLEKFPGVDLVAFSVGWWKTIGRGLPRLFLGCEAWDWIFAGEIMLSGGREIGPCVLHQRHGASWMAGRYTGANLVNRQAAGEWAERVGWDRVLSMWPNFRKCVE